jgi:hypothetical protein
MSVETTTMYVYIDDIIYVLTFKEPMNLVVNTIKKILEDDKEEFWHFKSADPDCTVLVSKTKLYSSGIIEFYSDVSQENEDPPKNKDRKKIVPFNRNTK